MSSSATTLRKPTVFEWVIRKKVIGRIFLALIALAAIYKLAISFAENPAIFVEQVSERPAARLCLCADCPGIYHGVWHRSFD